MTLLSIWNGEHLNTTHDHDLTLLDILYLYPIYKGNALCQASLDPLPQGESQMAKKVVLCISNPIPVSSQSLLDP